MKQLLFRHSVKNLYRSPGKTLLYMVLIAALTALLCLEMSVYVSVNHFLDEAQTVYTTIAQFEYLGEHYPNATIRDPKRQEVQASLEEIGAFSHEAVRNVNMKSAILGRLSRVDTGETIDRIRNVTPYLDESVLIVTAQKSTSFREDLPRVIINEALYSFRSHEGKIANISIDDYEFIPGHQYLIHGSFYSGVTSDPYFRVEPFTLSVTDETLEIEESKVVDLGPNWDGTIPEDSVMQDIADTYRVLNNSVEVFASDNLDIELAFHQQRLYPIEGRLFTEAEYNSGYPGILISKLLSEKLGLGVGEHLMLDVSDKEADSLLESYWAKDGFTVRSEFEIIGILNDVKETQHQVYIPKSEQFYNEHGNFGYTLATVEIENASRDQYFDSIDPALPPLVRMTIYDQGYAAVTDSFHDILRSTVLVLVASMLAGFMLLLLFAYMSIYRERENARVLMRLGGSSSQVERFMMYLPALIALMASALGAYIAYLVSDLVLAMVVGMTESSRSSNLSYSITNLSIHKDLSYESYTDPAVFIETAAIVFVVALILCYIILRFVQRKPKPKKLKRSRVRHISTSRSLKGGALRYASLSMARSGMRAVLPFAVALAATSLLLQMASVEESTAKDLETLRNDYEISGYFTTIDGQDHQDLMVNLYPLQDVVDTKLLDQVTVTLDNHFWLNQRFSADNEWLEDYSMPEFADTGFGQETFMNQLMAQPKLVFTNDFRQSPDFMYADTVMTEFMDGYSEEDFGANSLVDFDKTIGVIPKRMMEDKNIELGDVLGMTILDGRGTSWFSFQVVGHYQSDGFDDSLYVPLAFRITPRMLSSEYEVQDLHLDIPMYAYSYWDGQQYFTGAIDFKSVSFSLFSRDLDDFKEALKDEGFSEVNRIGRQRYFVVISDAQYLRTEASLTQRLNYMNVLYPVIYALTYILALVIPFIMILVRRREISVMRQTGTPYMRVFMSFFLELFILGMVGVALAFALRHVFNLPFSVDSNRLGQIFSVCWILASAFSIFILTRGPIRKVGTGE